MTKKSTIAIEPQLATIRDYLQGAGYHMMNLGEADLQTVSAVVVRGSDDNILGRQDTLTRVPVIEAAGRTPEEVRQELERRAIR